MWWSTFFSQVLLCNNSIHWFNSYPTFGALSVFIQGVFPFTDLTRPYKNQIHNQALVDSMINSTEIDSANNRSIVTGQDYQQCGWLKISSGTFYLKCSQCEVVTFNSPRKKVYSVIWKWELSEQRVLSTSIDMIKSNERCLILLITFHFLSHSI